MKVKRMTNPMRNVHYVHNVHNNLGEDAMNEIEIEFKSTNRTRGTVTAMQYGGLLHSDVLDIAKEADRFIDGLRGKVMDFDSGPIEERLLDEVEYTEPVRLGVNHG